jgi:hypothetical protein
MDAVYIETTIISYLRQKPSPQVVTAARQLLTHRWWNEERSNYELVVSQYVIDEASGGDPTRAADRLATLDGIPLLPHDPEIPRIAAAIVSLGVLPPKAQVDALHIATVAHHRIQYLLTWNCKHIANAKILPRIHAVLEDLEIPIPIICTRRSYLAMIRKPSETPIEEIHRIRREISDRFGGDIAAIAEDAARRQAVSNRPVWKPKHDEQTDAGERESVLRNG